MASPSQIVKSPRYPELDSLRGIAVLVVLCHHYLYNYDHHFNLLSDTNTFSIYRFFQALFYYGYVGVHLFFIISGFVIFMTLERTKSTMDFVVSRISRLYPAYWAAICLTLLFLYFLPVPTLGKFSTKEVVLNLTMFQSFFKVRNIDQVYWTLKLELLFYIIMYIVYACKQLRCIVPICIGWLLLSLGSLYIELPLKKYIDVLFILEFAPLFISGILFYKIKKQQKANILYNFIIISSLIVEMLWMIKVHNADIYSLLIVCTFYLTFYIFSFKGLAFLNSKVLLFFGSISYSLYLIHNVIGFSIIHKIREFTQNQLLYLLIPTIVSIAIAYLLNMLIEKPAMTLIRSKYKYYKASKGLD